MRPSPPNDSQALDYARMIVRETEWDSVQPVYLGGGIEVYAHALIEFRAYVADRVTQIPVNQTGRIYLGAQTWATICAAGFVATDRLVQRLLRVGGAGFISWEDPDFHEGAQKVGLLAADPLRRLRQDAEALIASASTGASFPAHLIAEYNRIRLAVGGFEEQMGIVRGLLEMVEVAIMDPRVDVPQDTPAP